MRFFVTGVDGQLGHDVMNELLKRGHEGVGSDIQVHWKRNPTTCRLCLGGTFLSIKRLNYRQR